jgi:hypothetical protein
MGHTRVSYNRKSVDDVEYVLIGMADFSNHVWLKQCKNDADSTVVVLIEWFAAFRNGSPTKAATLRTSK